MAVQYCSSFSLETLQGLHDFRTDTIKLALYDGSASFDKDTTAYTATNELASGDGYTTAGKTLSLSSGFPQLEDGWGSVRFDNVTWTFTASKTIKWGLLYNVTASNRAILSIDFGLTTVGTGDFTVRFPTTQNPVVQHRFSLG